MKLRTKTKLVLLLIAVNVFTIILNVLARKNVDFANFYSTTIYTAIVNVNARISNIFPFSIAELIIVLFIVSVITYLVCMIIKMFKKRQFKQSLSHIGLTLFLLVTAIFLVFTLTCGINYHRFPFSKYSNLTIEKHNNDDLIKLCNILIEDANRYVTDDFDEENMEQTAIFAMEKLAKDYPVLKGYYPKAKPVFFSEFMSYQFICGFYFPFSVESNYNNHMPLVDKPSTICHELSHLRGFMREDEAEFISYLACINSDDTYFKYSGTMLALGYTLNAVHSNCDISIYNELYYKLDSRVVDDFYESAKYWDQYRGEIANISNTVNNSYLIMNNQNDGVKSYGRIIDLLLAYYIK